MPSSKCWLSSTNLSSLNFLNKVAEQLLEFVVIWCWNSLTKRNAKIATKPTTPKRTTASIESIMFASITWVCHTPISVPLKSYSRSAYSTLKLSLNWLMHKPFSMKLNWPIIFITDTSLTALTNLIKELLSMTRFKKSTDLLRLAKSQRLSLISSRMNPLSLRCTWLLSSCSIKTDNATPKQSKSSW